MGIDDVHHLFAVKGIAKFDKIRQSQGFDFALFAVKDTHLVVG
jgi:hypothetical protein